MNKRTQVALIGGIANGLAKGISLSAMMHALANQARQAGAALTDEDHARIAAARAKQERKAAKKAAQRH